MISGSVVFKTLHNESETCSLRYPQCNCFFIRSHLHVVKSWFCFHCWTIWNRVWWVLTVSSSSHRCFLFESTSHMLLLLLLLLLTSHSVVFVCSDCVETFCSHAVTTASVFCLFRNRKSLQALKDTLLLSDRNDWMTRRARHRPPSPPCLHVPPLSLLPLRAPRVGGGSDPPSPSLNLGWLVQILGLNKLGLFGVLFWLFMKQIITNQMCSAFCSLLAVQWVNVAASKQSWQLGTGPDWRRAEDRVQNTFRTESCSINLQLKVWKRLSKSHS